MTAPTLVTSAQTFARVTYSFFAVRVRRACWAFFIFSSLALCCASVGFLLSGTLGLSFASNMSSLTCLGFDPRASIRLLASSVSATNISVSYTHLRAHETRHDLVCRLLLEKKKQSRIYLSCTS